MHTSTDMMLDEFTEKYTNSPETGEYVCACVCNLLVPGLAKARSEIRG